MNKNNKKNDRKDLKKRILTSIAAWCWAWMGIVPAAGAAVSTSGAADSQTTQSDSLRVEQLLKGAKSLPADSCRTLYFARQLLGVPYIANTLDRNEEEILVSRLDAFDCTTLVETVVALCLTEREGGDRWHQFLQQLEKVRYRQGKREGYASRLHYFSDWIADNEQKGAVRERTNELKQGVRTVLNLDFMTAHADRYPLLRHHPERVKQLAEVERAWQNRPVAYLPKHHLDASSCFLEIHNGDILALTTSIQGLDVVHVGFAVWMNDRLHLLHASSQHKRVILDPQPLHLYLQPKKKHTGIRVISVQNSKE